MQGCGAQHVEYMLARSIPVEGPAGEYHLKVRRWYSIGDMDGAAKLPCSLQSTACAIVPLNPNELTPHASIDTTACCVGSLGWRCCR